MVLEVTRPETAQKEEGVLRAAGGAVHVTSTSPRTVFFAHRDDSAALPHFLGERTGT